MKNSIPFDVDTKYGEGILEQLYLTELGYVMARIYFPEKGVWINFNVQTIWDLLKETKIDLKALDPHKKEEVLELA